MRSTKTERRAFLFRVGGLGDLLVALPAIALARRRLPDHHLTLVGRAEYAALLVRAGIVDEAMAFDDPGMAAIFAIDHLKRELAPLDGVELAMGWWNRSGEWPADEWWADRGVGRTCFITYDGSSGQPISRFFFDRTLGFFKISSSGICNAALDDHEEAAARGVSIDARGGEREFIQGDSASPGELIAGGLDDLFDDCARLALPAALIKKALDDLGVRELKANEKRLVVHPGSGGRAKRWPLPSFIEVARRAASRGLHGILVTGEAEEDLEPLLNTLALPPGWTRISRLPAETLAGLVASSTHYIGNDSGPTHLAAACGARVLAFFRDDNLPAWRPFGRTRVLSAPALDRIPLSTALPVIDDFLAS